ncbi:hypothetical protein ACF1YN_001003 [Escherichia coli]|uniref:hypothetical protein n=1 Tax=Escherichia coli TaxID=562 RepID=UPI000B8B5F46|nr:hypothetical protein [Escherichia coli]AVE92343.1 hypothetical protein AM456_00840 [Escherichia coli]EFK4235230.1 hypothetical protein [Escherichia coli]EHL6117893.1 hypothetical protein [Escherichia coli]EHL9259767.1 hypothetical protein [Escherichia coli]EHS6972576.1 hypothetical protein [Escherichia coli]
MNSIINKNIKKIDMITKGVKNISLGEDKQEILKLICDFEKMPRKEYSVFYGVFFNDGELVDKLIKIARFYEDDDKITINVISSLGNMFVRYKLYPSEELYNLFFNLKSKRKVNYYVSLFIFRFPQFRNYKFKWNYILSIPDISPKDKSKRNFYSIVNNIVLSGETIPVEYKNRVISLLEMFSKENMGSVYNDEYIDLINRLVKQHG